MDDDNFYDPDDIPMTQDCIAWDESKNIDLRKIAATIPTSEERRAGIEASERELDGIFNALREQGVLPEEEIGSTITPTRTTMKRDRLSSNFIPRFKRPRKSSIESRPSPSQPYTGFGDLLKEVQADFPDMPAPQVAPKRQPFKPKNVYSKPKNVYSKPAGSKPTHSKPASPDPFGDFDLDDSQLAKVDSLISQNKKENAPAPPQYAKSSATMPVLSTRTLAPLQPKVSETKVSSNTTIPPTSSTSKSLQALPTVAETIEEEDDPFGDLPDDLLASVDINKLSQQSTKDPFADIPDSLISDIIDRQPVPPKTESKSAPQEDDPFDDFPDLDLAAIDRQPKTAPPTTDEDPFDDFPDLDLAAIDKTVSNTLKISNDLQKLVPGSNPVPSMDAPVRNPRRASSSSKDRLAFSRYMVLRIDSDPVQYDKRVTLSAWKSEMVEVKERSKAIHRSETLAQATFTDIESSWKTDGHIFLRGEWFHTELEPGDIIHICSMSGRFSTDTLPLILHTNPPRGSEIDDLVLIAHPDFLLTPTYVTETITCPRRAVIKQRLGSSGISSEFPLYGTMRHQLFEETMKRRDFKGDSAATFIDSILRKNAESLVACGVTSTTARTELFKFLPKLQRFASEATSLATLQGSRKPTSVQSATGEVYEFLAEVVEAVEESVVSSELGLKGFVDMVLQATFQRQERGPRGEHPRLLVGVELKTGHSQSIQGAHMAQLILYILMLRAKHGSTTDVESLEHSRSGLLLYMNAEGYKAIPVSPLEHEVKSLLGQRNALASQAIQSAKPRGIRLSYETQAHTEMTGPKVQLLDAPATELPALSESVNQCERCYANRECMVYHSSGEKPSPMHEQLKREITGHLSPSDLEFFRHWDRLIDIEADVRSFQISDALLIPSYDREVSTSRTMSCMVLDGSSTPSQDIESDQGFAFFRRHASASQTTPLSSLAFETGCTVVISSDDTIFTEPKYEVSGKLLSIARGFVHNVTDNLLKVRVGKDMLSRLRRIATKGVRFRIDRDELTTGTGTLRQNLVNLFMADNAPLKQPIVSKLRSIIVSLKEPTYAAVDQRSLFTRDHRSAGPPLPGCDSETLVEEFTDLNTDQINAVKKVVSAQDYSLIQGLPGSGKTSTIAFVARLLAYHGKRVLISSYTHSAVDNVFLKLIEKGITERDATGMVRAVRIGTLSSCHPKVKPFLVSELARCYESADGNDVSPTAESLKKIVSNAQIVFVTALTVARSQLLVNESFDVVIVDEAGQISQPAILGPLMAAQSFVLVGDHMQLQPLVNSELAESGGYGISMLQRLADAHPNHVAQLRHQYRMNEDICALSNDIAYKGELICGNDAVRHRRLKLTTGFPDRLRASPNRMPWLTTAIDPANPVIFIDTDLIRRSDGSPQDETLERTASGRQSGSIVNDTEIELVRIATEAIIGCGLDSHDVGIICPFRAQLRLMDDCESLHRLKSQGVEISTIDKYQGRDKEAIILSFVRSNSGGKVGRILQDFRRLNVAVSRAKSKLIMIGSFKTLVKGSEVLRPTLNRLISEKRVLKLPSNF